MEIRWQWRVRLKFVPQDLWVGAFIGRWGNRITEENGNEELVRRVIFLSIVPMFPLKIWQSGVLLYEKEKE